MWILNIFKKKKKITVEKPREKFKQVVNKVFMRNKMMGIFSYQSNNEFGLSIVPIRKNSLLVNIEIHQKFDFFKVDGDKNIIAIIEGSDTCITDIIWEEVK